MKLRRLPVKVRGVPCPECGARLGMQSKDACFYYECSCGVLSYRYRDEDRVETDFPRFYGSRRMGRAV